MSRRLNIQKDRSDEALWRESRQAEEKGNFFKALDIQEQILQRGDDSYAVFFRLGWLHFKCGNYIGAVAFFNKALARSEGETWPLYGLKNCFMAMGDTRTADAVEQEIRVRNEQGGSPMPASVLTMFPKNTSVQQIRNNPGEPS